MTHTGGAPVGISTNAARTGPGCLATSVNKHQQKLLAQSRLAAAAGSSNKPRRAQHAAADGTIAGVVLLWHWPARQ